jgi:hypothetical protein
MKKKDIGSSRLLNIIAIVVLSILFLYTCYLLLKIFLKPDCINNGGLIGDTIGGITAPFIGLLSAYLIYITFTIQNKANKIQMKLITEERSIEINYKRIERIKEILSDVDYTHKNKIDEINDSIIIFCDVTNSFSNQNDQFDFSEIIEEINEIIYSKTMNDYLEILENVIDIYESINEIKSRSFKKYYYRILQDVQVSNSEILRMRLLLLSKHNYINEKHRGLSHKAHKFKFQIDSANNIYARFFMELLKQEEK